jgi:hypothetical protein
MTDYLLLYRGGSMPETPEEQAASIQAWTDWYTALGEAVKDGGNPTSGQAKTIAPDGNVSDGAGSVSGYTVIAADSLDDAVAKSKGCPVLQGGGSVEVHETFDVMAAMG